MNMRTLHAVYIASANGDNIVDEIEIFQEARWVSAPEAIWRLFEFELNDMYPAVINLHLHLPNQQSVPYLENADLSEIINSEKAKRTMLTEFLNVCTIDEKANGLLYREFPEHYVWNRISRRWFRRKKGKVVGRIYGANPMEGERYYLRLLLNNVKSPKSFQDLLTVNGRQYSTFKESALQRGLLDTDNSISECMNEAAAFKMPQSLRKLFATLLVYCQPANVRQLWDDYLGAMSEDFKRQHKNSVDTQIQCTLRSIRYFLESMGKNIESYDLPPLEVNLEHSILSNKQIEEEKVVQTPPEDFHASSKLNPEQEIAYKTIISRVDSNKNGIFFVDGPGGTGKTFLYRAILANIRSRGMLALATTTSGVAAAIMPGGRTTHSRFKIPIITTESSLCDISKQGDLAALIREAKLIIWDEAPMAKRFAIETVDKTFRDILESSEAFRGKVMVFGGDFRQVLPVVPRASRHEIVNASLVKSYLWKKMEKLKLTRNMRARNDQRFGEFLLLIGDGEHPTISNDLILLPDEMTIKNDDIGKAEDELINTIFPSLHENAHSAEYMTNRAILATTNESVDQLNAKMINLFPGESKEFRSFDTAIDDTHNYYQEEFLNSLCPNGLPPYKLELKINCPIILLRNLDPANGLCNGTRMVCKGFSHNVIQVEISIGQHTGKQVFLPRIPLCPSEDEGYPFKLQRRQFPIRLCFAMTINKAQGQTIPNVGVYLPQHVFSHGQLYVALSRGTSMSTTKVLVSKENSKLSGGTYTKNIVFKEVFSLES